MSGRKPRDLAETFNDLGAARRLPKGDALLRVLQDWLGWSADVLFIADIHNTHPLSALGGPERFVVRTVVPLRIAVASCPTHMSDDDQALDLAFKVPVQKFIVVFEDYATTRKALGAAHVTVREETGAAKDVAAAYRDEAQRLHAMKRLLPQYEIIDIWWCRPAIFFVHLIGIVQHVAQPRVGFQSLAIGHVDDMRSNIVNRGQPTAVEHRFEAIVLDLVDDLVRRFTTHGNSRIDG